MRLVHWEGDLIIGANNASAVVTLVERVSAKPCSPRYRTVTPRNTPPQQSPQHCHANQSISSKLSPGTKAQKEMACWADIEQALGIDIYFCEPRSPWQRASNEQTNALLRRWLPKHTNLNINPAHLAIIEDNLNHMPRKLHNWQSAHNTYTALIRNHH